MRSFTVFLALVFFLGFIPPQAVIHAATVTVTAIVPAAPGSGGAGGAGGGGGGGGAGSDAPNPIGTATVTFTGRAYPGRSVTLIQDNRTIGTTISGSDAAFSMSISKVSAGSHVFGLYSEDLNAVRSALQTFPLKVTANLTTVVSGVFIAPTISLSDYDVEQGDPITVLGQSTPGGAISITVGSVSKLAFSTTADASGLYAYSFTTDTLEEGKHTAQARASYKGAVSGASKEANFTVGGSTATAPVSEASDLNDDNRVNLVDFSVAAYWYKKSSPPPEVDLNHDGVVNIVDFSILAYNWTG